MAINGNLTKVFWILLVAAVIGTVGWLVTTAYAKMEKNTTAIQRNTVDFNRSAVDLRWIMNNVERLNVKVDKLLERD